MDVTDLFARGDLIYIRSRVHVEPDTMRGLKLTVGARTHERFTHRACDAWREMLVDQRLRIHNVCKEL
jgi:hypothetical protein